MGLVTRLSADERLDVPDVLDLLRAMCVEIALGYVEGAVDWVAANPDLAARLCAAEAELDRLSAVPGGALRCDWTAAVGSLLRLWREVLERYRRHRAAA